MLDQPSNTGFPRIAMTFGDAYLVTLKKRKRQKIICSLVDADEYERIARVEWRSQPAGKTFYAEATSLACVPQHHSRMHAYIMRVTKGLIVDHINGDTLDNRKQNMRIVTREQNAQNARRQTFVGKTSRFKGVCWSKFDGCWISRITAKGETVLLGRFDAEDAAAIAYDKAAEFLHGEYARTNAVQGLFDMEDPFVPDATGSLSVNPLNRHPDERFPIRRAA